MNLTLVAHYGPKSVALEEFVRDVQGQLRRLLADAFQPYSEEQVHGTIVGLEGTRLGGQVVSRNYLEQRRLLKAINLADLLGLLTASPYLPFTVEIGGYHRHTPYAFMSRGEHPYLRSFSVQGSIAVAMGWPVQAGEYPPVLDNLRRSFNAANVLHKYHALPTDVDNDFFFVLGRVDRKKTTERAIQMAQDRMRDDLEQRNPLAVPIDTSVMTVVAYNDETLPWPTCRRFSLTEAGQNVEELLKLYDDPMA